MKFFFCNFNLMRLRIHLKAMPGFDEAFSDSMKIGAGDSRVLEILACL